MFLLLPFATSAQVTNLEVISREVSVFNLQPEPVRLEAISREMSVFNLNAEPVVREAISREFSVQNVGELTNQPPVILVQPQSQSVIASRSAPLLVSAIGSAPLRYQWRKEGLPVSRATNSSLTVTNVPGGSMGNYSVVVSNAWGVATSAAATVSAPTTLQLAVQGPGTITASPPPPDFYPGETVTLTAAPARYHTFLRWLDGNTNNPRSIIMGASNNLYVAVLTNTVPLELRVLKQWEATFGGTLSDEATVIRSTSDGGYIVGGTSFSGANGNKGTTNYGSSDIWIIKLDLSGHQQWERVFGGTNFEGVSDIVLSTDGGYLLAGSSYSGASGNKTSASFGNADFWAVKIDALGSKQWEKTYGGSDQDLVSAAVATADGGYVLAGGSASVPGSGGGNRTAARFGLGTVNDVWMVQIDALGNMLRDISHGAPGGSGGDDLVLTPDGGYLLAGTVAGSGGDRTSPNLGGVEDMWLLKLRADGSLDWERAFGSPGQDYGTLHNLRILADGSSVMVGRYNHVTNDGGYLVRVSPSGATLFERTYGGAGVDVFKSLDAAPDGGVFVGGESDTSPGSGTKTAAAFGGADYWVVKTDGSLNKQWEISFGGSGNETINQLLTTSDGGFVLAGRSDSTPESGSGNKTSPNFGGNDFWIIKATESEYPIGTPIIFVNGFFALENHHFITGTNPASVTLTSSIPNAHLYYTLDGSEPDFGSAFYTGPFNVGASAELRVFATDASENSQTETVTNFIDFVPSYLLADLTPGGGSVALDPPGGSYLSNTLVTLTASNAPGWSFAGWTGDAAGASNVTSVTMNGNRSVRAIFTTTVSSVSSGGAANGTVLTNPPGGVYAFGQAVVYSAIPAAGKYFLRWNNNAYGSNSPLVLLVTNANIVNNALFSSLTSSNRSLTILYNGAGLVTRTQLPNFFLTNTVVTLTAVPVPGWVFTGWSGDTNSALNPLALVMNTNKIVTANFELVPPLSSNSIFRIVGSVNLGAQPASEIAMNPNTDRVYISGGYGQSSLTVINATDKAHPVIVTVLSGAGGGVAVNPVLNRFYSSGSYAGTFLAYDGASNLQITNIYVGSYCGGWLQCDPDRGLVYLASQCGPGNDPLHVFDASSHSLVAGPLNAGGIASSLFLNTANGRAYFARDGGTTRVFGPAPGFLIVTNLADEVFAVNSIDNRLYCHAGADIVVRDGNTHALMATIPGIVSENAVTFGPTRRRLYMADPPNQVIKVIDGLANAVTGSFSLGLGVTPGAAITLNEAKNRLYCVGTSNGVTSLYVVEETAVFGSVTVAITNPPSGANFTAPANIPLNVTTTDTNGTISRVDYYASGNLIGTASNSPFSFTWSNVTVGNYALTALATDNSGFSGTSSPVNITITTALPLIFLTSPTNGNVFLAPINVLVSALVSDADNSVGFVRFYDGATLLGSITNPPYRLTWTNTPLGAHSFYAVAHDLFGPVVTSAPPANVTVTSSATNVPVFSWSNAVVSVGEAAGSVTVHVFKSADSAQVPADLGFHAQSASADTADFTPPGFSLLSFAVGETVKPITIGITQDSLVESNHYFFMVLDLISGSISGPADAQITILDDDVPGTNSFLTRVAPGALPSPLGTLRVNLSPTNVGQWRFSWENAWHDGGAQITGLPPGNYELQFKPVSGYVEPLATYVAVITNTLNAYTFVYSNTTAPQLGSLVVNINPAFVATNGNPNERGQWRRVGEGAWHNSGETVDALPAGSVLIEFKLLTAGSWQTPSAQEVTVLPNQLNSALGEYFVANPTPGTPPTALNFSSQVQNPFGFQRGYQFVGQLLTPLGWGSGTVVKQRVVLTAAHVVFDDYALAFVPNSSVKWFFQRQAGEHEPAPQTPRGFVVSSGYAAQRQSEANPGLSGTASRDLDIAALYFGEAAGRGGFSGYLVSRPGQEYLQIATSASLAGYPVEGIPAQDCGKMHRTADQAVSWSVVSNQVYATTDIKSYPGNSGGPILVQLATNVNYWPAAVYLGGSGNTIVRAIDDLAVGLINTAEVLGNAGGNNTGGEPPRRATDCPTCSPLIYGVLEVSLTPTNIGTLGGGYRFRNTTNGVIYREPSNRFFVLGNVPWTLEFLPAPYTIAPTNRTITTTAGHTNKTTGLYKTWGQIVFDGINFRALGSSGSVYRLDFKSNLNAATWTPLRTQTLTATSLVLTNLVPGSRNGFIRAVLLP